MVDLETKKAPVAENQQEMVEQLAQLEDNKIFQEVRIQLMQQLKIKRKEQRSALLKCDSMDVFRIEATISGLELFFKVFDGKAETIRKLSGDSPTVFKY